MIEIPQAVRGRVITEHKASYVVASDTHEYIATVRGHFHDEEDKRFPKVGDYVLLSVLEETKAVIESIEERTSEVVRKSAHDETIQVMVTNVDYVFIVMGLDDDFNLRRLERYLVLTEQAHITPVIILNKVDVVDDVALYVSQTKEIAKEVQVHAVSAKTGEGMEVFTQYLKDNATGVLLGSSGAGKSTITNHLLEHVLQETKSVRETDSRGRHTTTTRELFKLPSGGCLIDTPGMRELGFVTEEDMSDGTFSDVELLAYECKFPNCDHIKSAGCAIQTALVAGDLDQKHFNNYLKLQQRNAETRSSRKRD